MHREDTESRTTLPPPGISLSVHAGDEHDGVIVEAVEEGIGEALWDESATSVAV